MMTRPDPEAVRLVWEHVAALLDLAADTLATFGATGAGIDDVADLTAIADERPVLTAGLALAWLAHGSAQTPDRVRSMAQQIRDDILGGRPAAGDEQKGNL